MGDSNSCSIKYSCGADAAIDHFKRAVSSGANWYLALLESMGLWDRPLEVHEERDYRYLIAGEAFDWLLLAERLCDEVDGAIPEREKLELLFFAKPPVDLSKDDFRRLIGSSKYRAHLNYFYGVVVEEALQLAVEEEVRKEWGNIGGRHAIEDEVHERLYGLSQGELLAEFQNERHYPNDGLISLNEMREFIYWLFKYRLRSCDRARVASDTKKGLDKLQRLRELKGLGGEFPP